MTTTENSLQTYSPPAIAMHWLMAALIIAGFGLGAYLDDLPLSPTKLALISYHKWIGITVLLLLLPRLLVRLFKSPPAPLPGPAWQLRVAAWTHGLLYLLMAAIPLTGWLMSSAKGFPVVYFGVIPLPDLIGKDKEMGDLLKQLHGALNAGLFALVGLHVAAAIKHHVIDRDDTLRRMKPFAGLRKR